MNLKRIRKRSLDYCVADSYKSLGKHFEINVSVNLNKITSQTQYIICTKTNKLYLQKSSIKFYSQNKIHSNFYTIIYIDTQEEEKQTQSEFK